MEDRDGIKTFKAWLFIYMNKPKYEPPSNAPLTVGDLREAWVQGVAWGRQHPEEKEAPNATN